MTRSNIRENVFKLLFRAEFHENEELNEQFEMCLSEVENASESELEYIKSKFMNIVSHIEELDEQINAVSKGWKTSRMSKMDLAILRLALYEIKYEEDIPEKVSINEAIELAKKYGTDGSYSFVNGILAKFIKKEEN